jgi:hypothetical protein
MPQLKPIASSPYRVTLSPAACSLDLGDGSERGEYVNQDYILSTLGRPHRAISLMYCYYPLDKGWPKRASIAFQNKKKKTWGFPYDDYFPYPGQALEQMKDIRRHGQDVSLTLTADCAISDAQIRSLAKGWRPFGRMRLRLNHECDGFWFVFNRRYSYQQVGDFFVRFARILKQEAPNVLLACCWGHLDDKVKRLKYEEELSQLLSAADIWTTDKYISLHHRWPYDDCQAKDLGETYFEFSANEVWDQVREVHKRFVELEGQDKGIELAEFNTDGDVGGGQLQVKKNLDFYKRVLKEKPGYLKGITFYQFRDRGRLGLEREDENNPANGKATPFLPVYKKLLQEPYFQPKETWSRLKGGLKMEWRASDDSDGLGWKIPLKAKPIFLELVFEKKVNLMIKAGNQWFYKKPGVEWVDVTSSAADWSRSKPFPVVVFAPPADGVNPVGSSRVTNKLTGRPNVKLLYKWSK